MANIMQQVKLKNRTSRNGFDLSKKFAFTAKAGQLLPVYVKECIPGDKFNIDINAFTRTAPVETAAFTRMREYFDFFFVPTNLLWNKFNTFVTNMVDNKQSASSINDDSVLTTQHPYFTYNQLGLQQYRVTQFRDDEEHYKWDIFGFSRSENMRRLFEYLGYGDFYNYVPGDRYNPDVALNPFPLLAYQKIYQDYYRNSQWEQAFSPAWNINYMTGEEGTNNINLEAQELRKYGMCDLRYANWNKDYFMGLLPKAQYGDSASIDLSSLIAADQRYTQNFVIAAQPATGSTDISIDSNSFIAATNNGSRSFQLGTFDGTILNKLGIKESNFVNAFTILSLRQAEAKQKWAEITQSQQQDYKAQVEAHFGVQVSDAYSERCKYLGGTASSLDINEVVNQNLALDTDKAEIAGKGVGVTNGHIEFDTKVHGYIMCIYHCVPLLDYSIDGIKRQNLKTMFTDYAIPEFDATGMVSVPLIELTSKWENTSNGNLLGYAPRYIDYKTDIDEVVGAFKHGGLQNWVAPVDNDFIQSYLANVRDTLNSDSPLTWAFFKVNPATLDPIFGVAANDLTSTDQLRVNAYFKVHAVRNLDYNGLPY